MPNKIQKVNLSQKYNNRQRSNTNLWVNKFKIKIVDTEVRLHPLEMKKLNETQNKKE